MNDPRPWLAHYPQGVPATIDPDAADTALAVGSTGAEFGAFIRTEQARWKQVIERAQIKPEGMG